MSTFEPDDGFDELLRSSMHDEADTVVPAGDGLSRIQQRVSARRARQRWLRPTMALGSAAAVAVVAVGAYAAVHNSGTDKLQTPPITTQPSTEPPSVNPSPSPTPPPAAQAFPKRGIFPFVSAKDERAWEQQAAASSADWHGDPQQVATNWMSNVLQVGSLHVTREVSRPTKVDVVLGRDQADASSTRSIDVTTVHLVKYGKAWIVTGASDGRGQLRIGAPAAGSKLASPVTVSGPGYGVDEAAHVMVRDATTPATYGDGRTGSFGVQGWSANVSFSAPTSPIGVILVVETSSADTLPSRVTAEQVRFGSSSVSASPQYFYGIKDGRVTKFHSSDASSISFVTPADGGSSDPQLLGDRIYYLTGITSCGAHVNSIATSGGTAGLVAAADSGYSITGFGLSQDRTKVAFFEKACQASTSPQGKLAFLNLSSHNQRSIDYAAFPPYVVGDPSWEPDGVHVDAIVHAGMGQNLARFDSTSTTSSSPSRSACPGYDVNNGRPWALETDPSGTIWFATQTGSSMQVVKCGAGGQTSVVAFTVPGNRQPQDVDVSSDGSVLLTDSDGHIWRWDGSGEAHQLSPHQPVTDVTW
jgi:hypothetical protein